MADNVKTPAVDELMRLAIICGAGSGKSPYGRERMAELEAALTALVKDLEDAAEYSHELLDDAIRLSADRDQLRAERDALKALQDEQDSILDSCGTILCRHQINHERFDGCLYCDRDEWKRRVEETKSKIEDWESDLLGIEDQPINGDSRQTVKLVLASICKYLASGQGAACD